MCRSTRISLQVSGTRLYLLSNMRRIPANSKKNGYRVTVIPSRNGTTVLQMVLLTIRCTVRRSLAFPSGTSRLNGDTGIGQPKMVKT